MTTPCSGAISLNDVRNELGNTGIITMNDGGVRTLAGKPSGIIKMSDLRCRSDTLTGWINVLYPLTSSVADRSETAIVDHADYDNFKPSGYYPTLVANVYKNFDRNGATYLSPGHTGTRFSRGGGSRKVRCISDVYLTSAKVRMLIEFTNKGSTNETPSWTNDIGVGVSTGNTFKLSGVSASAPCTFIKNIYTERGTSGTLTPGAKKTFILDFTAAIPSVKIGSAGSIVYLATSFSFENNNFDVLHSDIYNIEMDFYLSGI